MRLLIGSIKLLGLSNNGQTFNSSYVDCFSNVKALRKSTMVCTEESQDVLPRSLISLVHLYTDLHQFDRVDHEGYAIQKLPFPSFLEHKRIELLLIALGDDIPCLCGSFMAIVDGVEPKILHMPAERRKLHAHIHPRYSNSTDLLIVGLADLQNGLWRLINIV